MAENQIILICDAEDYKSIISSIAQRERSSPLPDGQGNQEGRVIAEICRGWKDYQAWFFDNETSEAEAVELAEAMKAGFDLVHLKNEILRRIKSIKGIGLIGSGSSACCADISFELAGKSFSLQLHQRGDSGCP